MEDHDEFETFYRDSFTPESKEPAELPLPGSPKSDAKLIKVPLNVILKKINKLIGDMLKEQNDKGTRKDLIVTLMIGTFAFGLANLFILMSKDMAMAVEGDEFKETFMKMYDSALRTLSQ